MPPADRAHSSIGYLRPLKYMGLAMVLLALEDVLRIGLTDLWRGILFGVGAGLVLVLVPTLFFYDEWRAAATGERIGRIGKWTFVVFGLAVLAIGPQEAPDEDGAGRWAFGAGLMLLGLTGFLLPIWFRRLRRRDANDDDPT